jgi:small subunit ribosomal protein S16
MLKIRLKKYGRKRQASYRIIAISSESKRDGRAVEELGFYNPHTKETNLNVARINVRIGQGAQPTQTIQNLLKKVSEE